jgi:hypothetical protein
MIDRSHSNAAVPGTNAQATCGSSRRELLLAGGAGALGLTLTSAPSALARGSFRRRSDTQEVLNVASTVEVLTTVVTTTALQKLSLPQAAIDTIGAASREELEHYVLLTRQFGGHAAITVCGSRTRSSPTRPRCSRRSSSASRSASTSTSSRQPSGRRADPANSPG